jgi:hypothetical protein
MIVVRAAFSGFSRGDRWKFAQVAAGQIANES